MMYSRLKQEEKRARELRAEIEQEQSRERSEKPAVVAYSDFASSLPELAKDPTRRPELRRAIQSVLERITLDPHAENGRWTYDVYVKGAIRPVTVICTTKPKGWLFQSLRPSGVPPATCATVMAGQPTVEKLATA